MARKRRDPLPGGESSLRNAESEFTRPMLSPGLAALNHDAFVLDDTYATSVDLATHCPASSLDDLVDLDLDLGSRRARQPSRVVRTHSVTPAQAANGTGRGTAAATGQRVLSFFA
ncbi:MAG: hypothetical protein ACXVH1_36525 [Solirubrobacteraceae bacterium]